MSAWDIIKCTGCLITGVSLIFMSLMDVYAVGNVVYEYFDNSAEKMVGIKTPAMTAVCLCVALIGAIILFDAGLSFFSMASNAFGTIN